MRSSLNTPLAYLDFYLEKAKFIECKNYSSGIIKNIFQSPYDELDNKLFNNGTKLINEMLIVNFFSYQ